MRLMNFRTSVVDVIRSRRFVKKKVEEKQTVSAILFNISSGIGDAIMAMPILNKLRTFFPATTIDVLVRPESKSLFEGLTDFGRLYVLPTSYAPLPLARLCFRMFLKKYDFYIGCIPSNTIRQMIIPLMPRIPCRIKHRTPHRGFRDLDFLFTHVEPIPDGRHRVDCNMDLLKYVGIDPAGLKPSLHLDVTDAHRESVLSILRQLGFEENRPTVGFHPGCNPLAAFKRWPPDRYAQLADYLQDVHRAQVMLVGGRDEMDDVARIVQLTKRKPIVLAGRTKLMETAAAIKHCAFFVSNDSGVMHLATAVGVPTFAIFGPKDDRHVGPYGPGHTVIRHGRDVMAVSVDQVIETLENSPFGLTRLAEKSSSKK